MFAGLLGVDGSLLWTNRLVLELIGHEESEVVGELPWEADWWSQPPELEARLQAVIARAAGGETVRIEAPLELEGEERLLDVWISPVHDDAGRVVNLLSLAIDITDRKRSEAEVHTSRQRLTSLTVELQHAEERQRRRMATYLHDEIGQSLAVLRMKLVSLDRAAAPEGLAKPRREMLQLLDDAIEKTRSFTVDLSPPILDELGLEAAAEWIGRRIAGESGLDFTFEDDGSPKPLDQTVVPLLFRGTRELLMNSVKHAHASRVKVSIFREDGRVAVEVEDNGRGFDPLELESGSYESGFGLFSLRERLHSLGGHLTIVSSPGKGTRGVMTMPVSGC